MSRSTVRRVTVVALALTALGTGGAQASASGGGGGGGSTADSTTSPSGSTPCVQVNALNPVADQSVVTDGAWLQAPWTVSRCGGNNASFTVAVTAEDAGGVPVLTSRDTWYPTKNVPYSGSAATDAAAFATAYRVTLRVLVPETGAVVATATRSVSTPDARVASCVNATNLGGTAGYYPGRTTDGALWLSYSLKNCGGREAVDAVLSVRRAATGEAVAEYPVTYVMDANSSSGVGLLDVEPVPTGTGYEVRVEARRRSDGQLLASRSIGLTTPPAK